MALWSSTKYRIAFLAIFNLLKYGGICINVYRNVSAKMTYNRFTYKCSIDTKSPTHLGTHVPVYCSFLSIENLVFIGQCYEHIFTIGL